MISTSAEGITEINNNLSNTDETFFYYFIMYILYLRILYLRTYIGKMKMRT